MVITSRQNDNVKRVCSLKNKKYRDFYGEYVVEGEKLILEALETGMRVRAIFATEGEENFALKVASDCENKFGADFSGVFIASQGVFEYMSDEVTPKGVLAVLKIPENPPISRLTRCLLLDRVQDPKNVGAILRLAAAAGVNDIFTISCADVYSPKAVRSSMSGVFRVNVREVGEGEILSLLKESGVPLICADMDGENVFEYTAPERFCLCVGNEGQGVSDNIFSASDVIVRVPMKNGIESLNVGIAAGITLYALIKQ